MTTRIVNMLESAASRTVLDRLVRAADRLEGRSDGLADDFVSARVAEVLRTLARHGHARADGSRRSEEEQAEYAEALLRAYWRRTAWRDRGRQTGGQERGTRPVVVSLDALRERGWDAAGADTACARLDAWDESDLRRTLARRLEAAGWARERAWMYVWFVADGCEWAEVAELLRERFGLDFKPAALRKWAERRFGSARPVVAALLAERRQGASQEDGARAL